MRLSWGGTCLRACPASLCVSEHRPLTPQPRARLGRRKVQALQAVWRAARDRRVARRLHRTGKAAARGQVRAAPAPRSCRELDGAAAGCCHDCAAAGRDLDCAAAGCCHDCAAAGRDLDCAAAGRDLDCAAVGRFLDCAAASRDLDGAAAGHYLDSTTSGRDLDNAAAGRDLNNTAAPDDRDAAATLDSHQANARGRGR